MRITKPSVADNGKIMQIMIQAWTFLEWFFEACRSIIPYWPKWPIL